MPNDHRRATPRRDSLVETATELFYLHGTRAIGVDRLVEEARVTKATFYKHFPTKEQLIRAYVTDRIEATEDDIRDRVRHATDARDALQQLVAFDVAALFVDGFRGDALLNVAAEYPDTSDPIRQAITTHRAWLAAVYVRLFAELAHPSPNDAARDLLQARDGAMMTGVTGEPADAAAASLQRSLSTLFHEISDPA